MPPKGWRKYQDGFKAAPGAPSNVEDEKFIIDDILFPRKTLLKLTKESLNEGDQLSKDSLLVVQRSATSFITHIMDLALSLATDDERQVVTSNDVSRALSKAGFEEFVPVVDQQLQNIRETMNRKKATRRQTYNNPNQKSQPPQDLQFIPVQMSSLVANTITSTAHHTNNRNQGDRNNKENIII